jgi:hypothetical protein
MNGLLEFYDDNGRCFDKARCDNYFDALATIYSKVAGWRGLGFRNASYYERGVEIFNLEIKDR